VADFFIIVELIKYFELDTSKLIIYNSFTYQTKVKTPTLLDSYFTTLYGAIDNTNKETLNIKGLIINVETFYSRQTSITDCEDNENSFYFDIDNQMLYIHFDHDINPYVNTVEYGKVFGYTNDDIRNFNGIDYLPLILSIPKLSIKVDPLRYTQQGFYGGNVIMNNHPIDGLTNDGPFDSNEEFTGNDIFIYYGKDGYDYDELILISNNYIENTIISMDEVIVVTKDKREQQSPSAPVDTFSIDDFPDLDPDLDNTIKPDAYGYCHGVPGICVNSEQTGRKTFYFASIITDSPAPIFKCKQDEKWTTITPFSTDYANGMATFNNADVHVDGDNTKGLENVRCDGYFRPYYNPADIITDLNLRFNDIAYNSSNYNTLEWEDEKQYLEDVGLYMDDEKELYEWIELLQNGSTVGFQYLFIEGRRTIRLDNPNRNEVKTIYSQEILNNPIFDNNEEFFATHAVVFYRKNHSNDKWKRKKNNDYYLQVLREHRKSKQYETESLLKTENQAGDKTIIIMEDQKKERPTGRLLLYGIEFYDLKLFDIINAEISYQGEKTGEEENDLYQWGDNSGDDVYQWSDNINVDVYRFTDYTKRDLFDHYREFLGWQRFQIIGLFPDFQSGNMEIEVRQRDYSDEFETITGYIPS
jgi:hypothetical protein